MYIDMCNTVLFVYSWVVNDRGILWRIIKKVMTMRMCGNLEHKQSSPDSPKKKTLFWILITLWNALYNKILTSTGLLTNSAKMYTWRSLHKKYFSLFHLCRCGFACREGKWHLITSSHSRHMFIKVWTDGLKDEPLVLRSLWTDGNTEPERPPVGRLKD